MQKCLKSLFSALDEIEDKTEVIVVDNGSTDDSIKYVQTFKRSNVQTFLIENKKNLGFARANNQGIRQASGDYILLLNPDTVVFKNTLKTVLDFMDKNINVGAVTCRVELPDGSLDDACHRGFPTPWNAFCYFFGLAKIFPKSQFLNGYHLGYRDIDKIHEIDSGVGAFMMIRKRAGDEVSWLNEEFFWYGEDLDFCYRLKNNKGWKIFFIPSVKIIHYKGISSGIKKHSYRIARADKKTKISTTLARFEAMKIFYRRHYFKKYPRFLTGLVFLAIEIKKRINLLFLS